MPMEIAYRPMVLGLSVIVGLVGFIGLYCLLSFLSILVSWMLVAEEAVPFSQFLATVHAEEGCVYFGYCLHPLMSAVASISRAVDGCMRITIQLLLAGRNTVPKEYFRQGQRASFCER